MTESKAVLVTGGAQGIGAAIVRRCVADGHRVLIADMDTARAAELAEQTGARTVCVDVADQRANEAAVAAAVEHFGGLDAVFLNAGAPSGTTFGPDFDAERYRRGMSVNLDGPVFGVNAALPALRARGGGSIVITSSLAGIAPSTDVYYSAAKHGLIGLVRSLAMHLAAEKITVNAMCPGFFDTRLLGEHRATAIGYGLVVADPDDIADLAAELLETSETGQVWEVQGGVAPSRVEFPAISLSKS